MLLFKHALKSGGSYVWQDSPGNLALFEKQQPEMAMLQVKSGTGQIAEAVALVEHTHHVDHAASPKLLAAVRARQHFVGEPGLGLPASLSNMGSLTQQGSPRKDGELKTIAESEAGSAASTPTAASALVDRRGISANIAQDDDDEVTLNRNVLRAYLAVEMVLGVQQAVRQNLDGTAKVVAKPPPKAQSSFTAVEITETTATQPGKMSAITTGAPATSNTLAVAMPGAADHEAGLSAQHHDGLAVAEEIEAEFTRAQKAAHLTARKAFNFSMQGTWRLLWLALMGDTSFWQEAMHLVDGSRGYKFLRYCLFPILVVLQAIATLSQVVTALSHFSNLATRPQLACCTAVPCPCVCASICHSASGTVCSLSLGCTGHCSATALAQQHSVMLTCYPMQSAYRHQSSHAVCTRGLEHACRPAVLHSSL